MQHTLTYMTSFIKLNPTWQFIQSVCFHSILPQLKQHIYSFSRNKDLVKNKMLISNLRNKFHTYLTNIYSTQHVTCKDLKQLPQENTKMNNLCSLMSSGSTSGYNWGNMEEENTSFLGSRNLPRTWLKESFEG